MSDENIQENEELIAEDLVKSYKDRTVVRGVNIRMRKGEIVGLLGKNGAGKTTTFYMIVGLVRPKFILRILILLNTQYISELVQDWVI